MKCHRQALLLSSSLHHGFLMPLGHAKQNICDFLKHNNVNNMLFIPYAVTNHDYANTVTKTVDSWGFKTLNINTYSNPVNAVKSAKAIFVGGGNTFMLLKGLYENKILEVIRKRVLYEGMVYLSYSAGTVVAARGIHNTNDMPVTYPPSFEAIGIVPFNINPHYLDKIKGETHNGKSQYHRIQEYLMMPNSVPVIGLKEGGIIHVHGNSCVLKGCEGAFVFLKCGRKIELPVGSDLCNILKED